MKLKTIIAVIPLFLLANLSPLFATFTVERNGDMITIKENGDVVKTVNATTRVNEGFLRTIETAIRGIQDQEEAIRKMEETAESHPEKLNAESIAASKQIMQNNIDMLEGSIRRTIDLLG